MLINGKVVNLIHLFDSKTIEGINEHQKPCKFFLPKGFIPVKDYGKEEDGKSVHFSVDGVVFSEFAESHSCYHRDDSYLGYYTHQTGYDMYD